MQAFDARDGKCVGTVVCKMGEHRGAFRGYIAMLVVLKPYRGRGIGDALLLLLFYCCFWLLNCCHLCSRQGMIVLG
jgi:ribosomal protein S18 acetylase RimI-like enzyme